MKRKLILGCLIPLVVLLGIGWFGFRALTRAEAKPERFEVANRGDVEIKVTETGTIQPLKTVEVKSKVAGRVARLYVQEGDRVHAGQVLADIDPTEINSQVAQIKAQCDAARAHWESAVRAAAYQVEQTRSSIAQAKQALISAQARLRSAREESKSQPDLTASDLAQARASLQTARDDLRLLDTSTHPQAVVQAQTAFDEAKAAEENARRNLDRQQKLLARGFVAQQVVDAARSDLAAASARLGQSRNRLDLIEQQNTIERAAAQNRVAQAQAALDRANANQSLVPIKQQEERAAAAAVAQAQAQIEAATAGKKQDRMRQDDVVAARAGVVQIENQLREYQVHQYDTRLVATMGGVVTRRYIEQGELVTSGVSTFSSGTPVLQVADLSHMLVKMSVNEVDVYRIRLGLPVELEVDGARGVPYRGTVSKVAPSAGAAQPGGDGGGQGGGAGVIKFAVEVSITNPDARLRPGMSARCTVVIARRRAVLRLPADCVEGDGPKAIVQIATDTVKDGRKTTTTTPRHIVAGLRGDTHVEVVSGLQPGDRVKPGIYTGPKRRALEIGPH